MGLMARAVALGAAGYLVLSPFTAGAASSAEDAPEWVDDPSWTEIAVSSPEFDRVSAAIRAVEERLEILVDRTERAQRLAEQLTLEVVALDEAVAIHHSDAVDSEARRQTAEDERVALAVAQYVGMGSDEAPGVTGPEADRDRALTTVYRSMVDEDRRDTAAASTVRRDNALVALAQAEVDRSVTRQQLADVITTRRWAEGETLTLYESRADLGLEQDELRWSAEVVGSDIPLLMLVAYHRAAAAMGEEQPRCQIEWTLLAGVGRAESNHARYGGARADLVGDLSRKIVGPRLDGVEFQEIFDTDGGRLDGDVEYDRAVGPMQFIPGTWRTFGRDGNGDGDKDPQNVFDATLAAADYLCQSGPLAGVDRMRVALLSYNQSDVYGEAVLASWRRYERLGLDPEEPWLGGPVPEKLAYLPEGAAEGLDGVSP